MSEQTVEHYYESNTDRFLRLGKTAGTKHIHRCLWGEGVKNLEEAAHYSVDLIAKTYEQMRGKHPESVLDLGCGVGSSMFYLSDQWRKTQFSGVTLSGKQAEAGTQFAAQLGLKERVRVLKGSFLDLKAPGLPGFSGFENDEGQKSAEADLLFSIEAFIHGTDPHRFFQEAASVAKRGSVLILVDDFPESNPGMWSGSDNKWKNIFQNGWLANTLEPVSELKQIAALSGWSLHSSKDLTPMVDMNRPRDKAIGLAVNLFEPLMRRNAYLNSLRGGHALQVLTNRGLLKYRMIVFSMEV